MDFDSAHAARTRKYLARTAGAIPFMKSVEIVFSVPHDGEECPICMEPMSQYRLTFMPNATSWFYDDDELTKASLPCGHSFSAMALLFHFVRNAMTCPYCRDGHDEPMPIEFVPSHLADKLSAHIVKGAAADRIEADREEVILITSLIMETHDEEGGANMQLDGSMGFIFGVAQGVQREPNILTLFEAANSSQSIELLLLIHFFESMSNPESCMDMVLPLFMDPLMVNERLSWLHTTNRDVMRQMRINVGALPVPPVAYSIDIKFRIREGVEINISASHRVRYNTPIAFYDATMGLELRGAPMRGFSLQAYRDGHSGRARAPEISVTRSL